MTADRWRERLEGEMPGELAREIEIFETQIELRKLGKVDPKVFAETRLRRGAYGQRYDNGQRHDGVATRSLSYPNPKLEKGPDTVWDAPGMMRIKIPYGLLTPEQLETLAALSEEYSDGISHITTRQDVQLHYVHIEDTPTVMRRLAAVGITTREACGNSVRNVTACQFSGVCSDEPFDVSPYAEALAQYLLGHPETQGFGRKFKIAFSGCADKPCGLTTIHDLGFTARVAEGGRRGFAVVVGGGLGAVPHPAKPYADFIPEEELLPLSLAICRVFTRLGEKRNRARARLKFVVQKLGVEAFRQEVEQERAALTADPRWTDFLADAHAEQESGLKPASSLVRKPTPEGPLGAWLATNVRPQKQPGYSVATITCPLGDLSGDQMRALADIARRFTRGTVRATVEQNLVLRWVSDADLPELFAALDAVGLGKPGAGTIVDVTACPGTDTCKLGIASSRGLASELSDHLLHKNLMLDEAVGDLHIKVSGCFNSCGQHHVADIGFWGVSRKVGSHAVPHFQAVLGGQWTENAKSYGLAVGAVPSKNVPAVVDRLVEHYTRERDKGESYQAYIRRLGKAKVRKLIEDLMAVPSYDEAPQFYSDWHDPREFTIGDLGVGECAGEVVSEVDFALAASEREVFEAQEHLEKGDAAAAAERSFRAMLRAARSLVKQVAGEVSEDPDEVVGKFREHLYDTQLFFDRYAGGKFGTYLFRAHEADGAVDEDDARQRIEEAQLFVEAAHSCYGRMVEAGRA
ncbi:MAG: nitrite/sulfite reductase [Polyangiaceae bacterium]